MKRNIHGQRAIVTGASSGIGREIALELARHHVAQILLARNAARLDEVAQAANMLGGHTDVFAGDITDESVRRQAVEHALTNLGGLDLFVNNAGEGRIGPFDQSDSHRLRRLLEVNLVAPLELIRAALPFLKQGRQPMIVNIGSVLGHVAVPNKSEYCASKFALRGFSDALRAELLDDGIDVLHVAPSTTRTKFFEKAQPGTGAVRLHRWNSMSAEEVARHTVRAIELGRSEVILSIGGWGLVWLHRWFPKWTRSAVARFTPRE